jgi:hypothetical protein
MYKKCVSYSLSDQKRSVFKDNSVANYIRLY